MSSRPAPPPQRLHKVMAQAGVASRRAAEELIAAGRVTVNGQMVVQAGQKVTAQDRIEVDGAPLSHSEQLVYVLLNKPRGVLTTLYDPGGRPTVAALVAAVPARVFPVGRLDFTTEGALLLTNDGELAHGLMHPSSVVWKPYIARIRGVPSAARLRELETGIQLDDGPTAPARVRLLGVKTQTGNRGNQVARVQIQVYEGRNRQVRRMFAALGYEVIGLARLEIGPLRLTGLNPGQFRYLNAGEIRALRKAAGLKPDPPRPLHAAHGVGPRSGLPLPVKKPGPAVRPQGRQGG